MLNVLVQNPILGTAEARLLFARDARLAKIESSPPKAIPKPVPLEHARQFLVSLLTQIIHSSWFAQRAGLPMSGPIVRHSP